MPAEGLLDEVVGPSVEAAQDAELVRVGRHLPPAQSLSFAVQYPKLDGGGYGEETSGEMEDEVKEEVEKWSGETCG